MNILNAEEEEILQLWRNGDDCKIEAIEKMEKIDFKDRRGLFLFEAFKRNMFDFMETVGVQTLRAGWPSILFRAGESNDLELIDKATKHVNDYVVKENLGTNWPVEEREKELVCGLAYGGHPPSFSANDYKNIEDYNKVVNYIIWSKKNEIWDKLDPVDLKRTTSQDQLYLAACQVGNSYVLEKLKNLDLVPTSVKSKLASLVILGEYKQLQNILLNSDSDVNECVNVLFEEIICHWNKSNNHQKILSLLIKRFGVAHPRYSLKNHFIRCIDYINKGYLQNFKQRKLFFQSIIILGQSDETTCLISLLNDVSICTSSLRKWIYDVDDLEILIKYGPTNLDPIRKKLPELFDSQNLLTLSLRTGDLLAKTNCLSEEELENIKTQESDIKDSLLQIFYPPLMQIILFYL